MILTGKEIVKAIQDKRIKITPFKPENVQPNSYDVSLSPNLKLYASNVLDCKKENKTIDLVIPEKGMLLHPNKLYLAVTNEYTESKDVVPMLHGKSSLGRLGIFVHVTAGLGDVGFKGKWVLEIVVTHPVWVYPNMKIGQIVYHEVKGDVTAYSGKYQNLQDKPVASKSFQDFTE